MALMMTRIARKQGTTTGGTNQEPDVPELVTL
jgi:hypothetical protein